MQQPRPMDRLICGDVGYGKTEVAIRAAFKAVDTGKQVAVLVPTTVLAEQHYRTFSAADGRVSVHRRVSSAASARPASRSASSKRLGRGRRRHPHRHASARQKDVQFKDLGLVIIDEEQRFGVEHKERLKHLRPTVDVLTLTATPIPRTLHLSLLGIRDISQPGNAAARPLADRDAHRPLRPTTDPPCHPARAEPRRAGLLRPQPRLRHPRDRRRSCSRSCPRRASAIGHGQMARRRAGTGDAGVRPHARPTSWWPRRSSRAAWTSPTPTRSSSTRPTTTAWPTCTSFAAASAATSTAPTPTCCSTATGRSRRTRRERLKAIEEFTELGAGLQDRHARPGDPRRRQHPRHASRAATSRPSATSCTASCWKTPCAALKQQPLRTPLEVNVDLPWPAYLPRDYVPGQKLQHRGLSPARPPPRARTRSTTSARSCATASARSPNRSNGCCARRRCDCCACGGRSPGSTATAPIWCSAIATRNWRTQLAAQSRGRVKVVDEKSLYLRLRNEEEPEAMYRLLVGVLVEAGNRFRNAGVQGSNP